MKFLTSFFICLFLISLAYQAEASGWTGTWSYVYQKPNNPLPNIVFTLKIKKNSKNTLKGSYCLITQSGRKQDCSTDGEENIRGRILPPGNKARLVFHSFGSKKNLFATAYKSGKNLTWIVTSPSSSIPAWSYEGPRKMVLNYCKNVYERTLKSNTTNVYDKPSAHAPVIRVLHRNDQIILEDLSSDQKFWKVKFSPSNSRPPIIGWVKLTAVPDNCGE